MVLIIAIDKLDLSFPYFNVIKQQFSVKINSLWNVDSGGKGNYFFAEWVWGGQFCNILVRY